MSEKPVKRWPNSRLRKRENLEEQKAEQIVKSCSATCEPKTGLGSSPEKTQIKDHDCTADVGYCEECITSVMGFFYDMFEKRKKKIAEKKRLAAEMGQIEQADKKLKSGDCLDTKSEDNIANKTEQEEQSPKEVHSQTKKDNIDPVIAACKTAETEQVSFNADEVAKDKPAPEKHDQVLMAEKVEKVELEEIVITPENARVVNDSGESECTATTAGEELFPETIARKSSEEKQVIDSTPAIVLIPEKHIGTAGEEAHHQNTPDTKDSAVEGIKLQTVAPVNVVQETQPKAVKGGKDTEAGNEGPVRTPSFNQLVAENIDTIELEYKCSYETNKAALEKYLASLCPDRNGHQNEKDHDPCCGCLGAIRKRLGRFMRRMRGRGE